MSVGMFWKYLKPLKLKIPFLVVYKDEPLKIYLEIGPITKKTDSATQANSVCWLFIARGHEFRS